MISLGILNGDKERQQNHNFLPLEDAKERLHFVKHTLITPDAHNHLCPIGSDDLVRRTDQQRKWKSNTLDTDKSKISIERNTTFDGLFRIHRVLNCRTDDHSEFCETEPDSDVEAFVLGFGISDPDGCFSHPEGGGGKPASCSAKEKEPCGTEGRVAVEGGRVGNEAEGTEGLIQSTRNHVSRISKYISENGVERTNTHFTPTMFMTTADSGAQITIILNAVSTSTFFF